MGLATEDHLSLQIQHSSLSFIHMLKNLLPNTHRLFKYFHRKRLRIWTMLIFSVFEIKAYWIRKTYCAALAKWDTKNQRNQEWNTGETNWYIIWDLYLFFFFPPKNLFYRQLTQLYRKPFLTLKNCILVTSEL